MGKLVLSPTRTYAPVIKHMLEDSGQDIHALIHCSGGAQTKILHFINGLHVIKDNLFEVPPLFKIIQEESQTDWREMYKVFNMGHRMEVYLPESVADHIISISKSYQIDAQVIGQVESMSSQADRKVTIKSQYGNFEYA